MDREQLIRHLKEKDKNMVARLFEEADRVRHECVGDEVHLRGIIEFSNYCHRRCAYCGLRAENAHIERYRMDYPEILEHAKKARQLGIPTVVLQSGEDPWYTIPDLCRMVERIKKLELIVTLSIGERSREEYQALREAGADRYLLRFETSDRRLYDALKFGDSFDKRIQCLRWLKELGYEAGSGIMLGLPGQTEESIADDILLFKELDLDMIGVGPFIAHPHTPLASSPTGKLETVLKTVALTRIVTRTTNIPATTAVGTIDALGRQKALRCGANVLMPNITATKYRRLYQIYPDKICLQEDAACCRGCVTQMVHAVGRTIAGE